MTDTPKPKRQVTALTVARLRKTQTANRIARLKKQLEEDMNLHFELSEEVRRLEKEAK